MELTEKKKLPPMLARLKKKGKLKLKKEDILKFGTKKEVNFLKEVSGIRKTDIFFKAHIAIEKLDPEYRNDPNADPEWTNGALDALGNIIDIFYKTLSREVSALLRQSPSEKQDDVKLLYKAKNMLQRLIEEYEDDPNADPEWVNGAINAIVEFGEELGIDLQVGGE
jgi:hypothetical protein